LRARHHSGQLFVLRFEAQRRMRSAKGIRVALTLSTTLHCMQHDVDSITNSTNAAQKPAGAWRSHEFYR
jgi:hypothetical protein